MPRLIRMTAILLLAAGTPGLAGEADVVGVEAHRNGDTWSFDVTLRHDDTGWDHFADKWEVVASDGRVLATRTLHHPHVDEQPFTRSLGSVVIPESVATVTLRAHDNVHGYGGAVMTVELPR
ncbi:MAG: hypothetical protein P1U88_07120 [Thalassobaculaceae bacterium]|nr:hypothetical protein [Thalassobaculaceae bacterium]